ncbi:MAG: hypothetical protein BroJett003_03900 [Planctomycetota bacterium]|nr:MAG: hypothetical protein BroJett003_03900 [Planctomycetota bacterium]
MAPDRASLRQGARARVRIGDGVLAPAALKDPQRPVPNESSPVIGPDLKSGPSPCTNDPSLSKPWGSARRASKAGCILIRGCGLAVALLLPESLQKAKNARTGIATGWFVRRREGDATVGQRFR